MVRFSLGGMVETELTVRIPRNDLGLPERILDWCKDNCVSYITNNGTYNEYLSYCYYINLPEERALFKLTWGEYLV